MHYALAQWHLHKTPMAPTFDEWWSKKLADVDMQSLTLVDQEQLDKLYSLAHSMIKSYEAFSNKNDRFWTPVLAEEEVSVQIPGTDCVLAGTIDLVIHNDVGTWVVDHKTYATFIQPIDMETNWQLMCYCWLVYMKTGQYADGAILNQLRKREVEEPELLSSGSLSLSKRKPVTYESFVAAIHKHGFRERSYAPMLEYLRDNGDYWNKREIIRFQPEFYKAFGDVLKTIVTDMSNNPHVFPIFSSRCSYCEFRIPCTSDMQGGYTDSLLHELYKVSESRVL